MTASNRDEEAIHQATEWFVRLQSRSISTEELTDFAYWRGDPINAGAYERVERLWKVTGRLKGDPSISVALRQALDRGRMRRWLTAIATDRIALTLGASLAALAVIFVLRPFLPPRETPAYQTGVGERSVIQLVDGTRVQLDTNSRLMPHLTDHERRVDLTAGQAYFDVRHDPAHPFVVRVADRVTVTALGTRFDIRQDGQSVLVSLFAGSVGVADKNSGENVRLTPGQSVNVVDDRFERVGAIPAASQPGWRDGRLSFHDTPLDAALAEINRYTTRPLRLGRPGLAEQPVSGDFSTDDTDGFAAAANTIFGAGAIIRDGES